MTNTTPRSLRAVTYTTVEAGGGCHHFPPLRCPGLQHRSARKMVAVSVIGIALLAFVGCKNLSSGGDSSSASASAALQPGAPALPPNTLALKQGRPPITYLVTSGGSIIVRDLDAGPATIVTGAVGPNSTIRIDASQGISFGPIQAKSGPIPAAHRYQILLDQSQH